MSELPLLCKVRVVAGSEAWRLMVPTTSGDLTFGGEVDDGFGCGGAKDALRAWRMRGVLASSGSLLVALGCASGAIGARAGREAGVVTFVLRLLVKMELAPLRACASGGVVVADVWWLSSWKLLKL